MDDMNAFERQVAGEVIRAAAPARPVDAAAVFAAIPATRSPKWRFQSMFSAAKVAVAGAIVALFGALLLAGVLPPSAERTAMPAVVGGGEPASSVEPRPLASPEATVLMYESTARLVVDPGPDPTDQDLANAEGAAVRYAEQAESRSVAQAVIESLDLDDSPESLLDRTSIATDALLLSIAVQDEDAQAARAVADAYGNEMRRRVQDSLITAEVGDVDDAIATNEATIGQFANRLRNLRRKDNKTESDRAEIISLAERMAALRRDIQDLQDSRADVRNRLEWFERPTVPEPPAQAEASEALIPSAIDSVLDLFSPSGEVATAVLVVDPGPNPSEQDLADAEDVLDLYAAEAKSRPMMVSVIMQLDLDEDAGSLSQRVSTTTTKDPLSLRIEVRDEDPERARLLALAVGDEMVERTGLVSELRELRVVDGIEKLTSEQQLRIYEWLRDVTPRVESEPARRLPLKWLAKPQRTTLEDEEE